VDCWGENLSGESGAPNVGNPIVWLPHRVELASGSRQIAGNYSTTCAVKTSGTVACWGYLTDQLGAAFARSIAGEVPDVHDAAQVAVGLKHACVLRQDQTVWCWGTNDAAQLGDGGGPSSPRPVRVALPRPATTIVAGQRSTCARLDDQRWSCWGDNRNGQIGPRAQPVIATPRWLDLSQVDLASQ
jgi:alpha-tubulin suppressor-like RCC1 family protein